MISFILANDLEFEEQRQKELNRITPVTNQNLSLYNYIRAIKRGPEINHPLRDNSGIIHNCNVAKAGIFLQHYLNNAGAIDTDDQITDIVSFVQNVQSETDNTLSSYQFNEEEILAAISKLNKKSVPGLDGFSTEMLHLYKEELAYPILNTINRGIMNYQTFEEK